MSKSGHLQTIKLISKYDHPQTIKIFNTFLGEWMFYHQWIISFQFYIWPTEISENAKLFLLNGEVVINLLTFCTNGLLVQRLKHSAIAAGYWNLLGFKGAGDWPTTQPPTWTTWSCSLSGLYPSTNPTWLDLPGFRVPASTAVWVTETCKPHHHDKVPTQGEGLVCHMARNR